VRARIVRFDKPGLIVQARWRKRFTIAYGEILTAERMRGGRGIRLHTRTSEAVRLVIAKGRLVEIEDVLRARGVRVVDCWGAMITPTIADFEHELERGPGHMRQSSDSAGSKPS
jgi:hypothetical protein